MKKLREKLHSQRGASILLALLFLLACMMVASSVLMAAVSNAGKIRSNYEEQQRYLALSSALRLVVDELERARYHGRYTVEEWNETITEQGEDNTTVTVSNIDYYRITQEEGSFTCGELAKLNADGTPDENPVLTFRAELDGLFAKEFTGVGYKPLPKEDENGEKVESQIASLPTNPSGGLPGAPAPSTRSLTVEVQGGGVEELFRPVTVETDMSQSRRIHLKATLPVGTKADGTPGSLYVMEAELVASLAREKEDGTVEELSAGGMPSISYPLEALPKSDIPDSGSVPGLEVSRQPPRTETTKEAITWKLDWISRETKEEQG